MNSSPTVVVKKGGFLTALVKGIFGTIIVTIVCGTALGLYGLNVCDRYFSNFTDTLLDTFPEWQKALPPVATDALNMSREPEYVEQLGLTTEIRRSPEDSERGIVVLAVTNKGDETVSWLTVRVVIEDESDRPFCELPFNVATPWAFECNDSRGPLLPGSTREVARRLYDIGENPEMRIEVADVQVWKGPACVALQPPVAAAAPALPVAAAAPALPAAAAAPALPATTAAPAANSN